MCVSCVMTGVASVADQARLFGSKLSKQRETLPASRRQRANRRALTSRARAAVFALAGSLLTAMLLGCAATAQSPSGSPSPGNGLIYRSRGEINALKVFEADGKDQAFSWEYVSGNALSGGDQGVLRLVRLDFASRKAAVVWEMPSPRPGDLLGWCVAVSQDGRRVATIAGDPSGSSDASHVMVSDDSGNWVPVTPLDNHQRFMLRWSPDGNALAYLRLLDSSSSAAVALPVPRPAQVATEAVLTPQGSRCTDIAWAPDSQRIYHVAYPPGGEHYLEAVSWPSLKRQRLFAAPDMGRLSVAARTGDVLFLATSQTGPAGSARSDRGQLVWRLSPSGRAEKTPVTLAQTPFLALVSPDGKRLAVVPRVEGEQARVLPYGNGLMVYSLADGTSRALRDFQAKPILSVDWALQGRALVVAERGNSIWLVNVDGELTNPGRFTLEEPPPAHPVPSADERSRKNLQELGLAVLTYLADHHDTFPNLSDMDAAKRGLAEYVKSKDVFSDPRSRAPYGANSTLSGKRLADLEDPLDTVVFYETVADDKGGRNVAFCDGNVTRISAERWEQIMPSLGAEKAR